MIRLVLTRFHCKAIHWGSQCAAASLLSALMQLRTEGILSLIKKGERVFVLYLYKYVLPFISILNWIGCFTVWLFKITLMPRTHGRNFLTTNVQCELVVGESDHVYAPLDICCRKIWELVLNFFDNKSSCRKFQSSVCNSNTQKSHACSESLDLIFLGLL